MSVHFPKILHLCQWRARGSLVIVTLSLGLLAASEPTVAQIVPVCDRTSAIRYMIVRLVPEIHDCADVTEAHLSEITELPLSGPSFFWGIPAGDIGTYISSLRPGTFPD